MARPLKNLPRNLALPIAALSLIILIGCGASSVPGAVFPDSPPPPGPAPASLVALSMASYVTGDAAPVVETVLAPPDPEGTRVDVRMSDEAGSGAYLFNPGELTFNVGDSINFVIESETEFHTFSVEELGIDASADAGESVEFNFKFDRAGTFVIICIPHETQGMVGTITVR